jgi:hypothetical protein
MIDKLYTWVLPGLFFLLMSFCSNRQRGIEQLKASASTNQMTALSVRLQVLKGKSDMLFLSSDTLLMQARNGKGRKPLQKQIIHMVDSINYDTIDGIDQQSIIKHEY